MAKVYWEVAVYKLTNAGYTQDTVLQSVIEKVDSAIVDSPFNDSLESVVSQVQAIKDDYFTGVTITDTEKAAILEECMNEIIANGVDYNDDNAPEDAYVVAFAV